MGTHMTSLLEQTQTESRMTDLEDEVIEVEN